MKVIITLEIDRDAERQSYLINYLSKDLEGYFDDRNYGQDLQTLFIGCICIKTKPGYEEWYKKRKPKYIEYKKSKSRITGQEIEIIKTYSYDIKIDNDDYDEFISVSDEDCKKILAREILQSLSYLDLLTKKIKDFDNEKFKEDMRVFFDEYYLI